MLLGQLLGCQTRSKLVHGRKQRACRAKQFISPTVEQAKPRDWHVILGHVCASEHAAFLRSCTQVTSILNSSYRTHRQAPAPQGQHVDRTGKTSQAQKAARQPRAALGTHLTHHTGVIYSFSHAKPHPSCCSTRWLRQRRLHNDHRQEDHRIPWDGHHG